MYEPFRVMNDSITRKVEEVMAVEEEEGSISGELRLVSLFSPFSSPLPSRSQKLIKSPS